MSKQGRSPLDERTEAPLMANHVQFEDMIVDFIGIGIETTKCIDNIIPTVCHRRVHQAGRSLS